MMFRRIFLAVVFMGLLAVCASAQKKEIAQAKANVKAGKSLAEAESSMRRLLADSANRDNEKIWIVLFDAVRKQYENVNEQMYLKQRADTAAFFSAAYRMFGVLEGLDSIEMRPDSRGNVRLQYRKRHAEYLNALRPNLYNGGLYHMGRKEYGQAYSLFAAYIDCAYQPLFSGYGYADKDSRMPAAAFYSVYCGYKEPDAAHTLKYAGQAQADTARLDMVYQYVADTYRQQKDTAHCVEVLQSGFARFPKSPYFFSHLFDYYFSKNQTGQAMALCDDAIAADTASTVALFAKSSVLLSQGRYDECVRLCDKVISADSSFTDAYLNAGLSYYNQAAHIDRNLRHTRENITKMKALYAKAMPYMQRYRSLAPDEKGKWGVVLYTIYLNLNMGREFDEVDKLLKAKQK